MNQSRTHPTTEFNVSRALTREQQREALYRNVYLGESQKSIADDLPASSTTISRVRTEFERLPREEREAFAAAILDEFGRDDITSCADCGSPVEGDGVKVLARCEPCATLAYPDGGIVSESAKWRRATDIGDPTDPRPVPAGTPGPFPDGIDPNDLPDGVDTLYVCASSSSNRRYHVTDECSRFKADPLSRRAEIAASWYPPCPYCVTAEAGARANAMSDDATDAEVRG